MRFSVLFAVASALIVRPARAQADSRRLQVGFLRADGIVTVAFIVTDSSIRQVTDSDTSVPLPPRWFITPYDGPPFDVRSGVMLRVFRYGTESGSVWDLGQMTDAPRGPATRPMSYRIGLALGVSVPAAVFQVDSSPSATRQQLLSLLQTVFVDSSGRRPLVVPPGHVPPTGHIRRVRTWQAPVPTTQDTLYVAHAERWYEGSAVWLFDLWATRAAGQFHVIRSSGPTDSDPSYKGGLAEEPVGLFTYRGRTFILFNRYGYLGTRSALAAWTGGKVLEVSP
jgi:hypothetical protein